MHLYVYRGLHVDYGTPCWYFCFYVNEQDAKDAPELARRCLHYRNASYVVGFTPSNSNCIIDRFELDYANDTLTLRKIVIMYIGVNVDETGAFLTDSDKLFFMLKYSLTEPA